jgi:hypothetical protein
MMYCTDCSSHESTCDCGDDSSHISASYCENCGTIGSEENDFNIDGLCDDCEEAWEEYHFNTESMIVEAVSQILEKQITR